jgi:GNAT superfamily N-acetyltransferase
MPSSSIKLRSLKPGDLGWVISRHGEIYYKEYGWNQEFEVLVSEIATAFAKKHDPKRERAWIAVRKGERLGCVFLVRGTQTIAKLRILLVEPSARGMGVGSLLVRTCLKFAKARGYKKVTLWTNSILHSARKIYEANGFLLQKEERHRSFGKSLTGQHWSKTL